MIAYMVLNKKNLPFDESVKVTLYADEEKAMEACEKVYRETEDTGFAMDWDDLEVVEIDLKGIMS